MRLCGEEKLRHAVLVCTLGVSMLAASSQIAHCTMVENEPYRYWMSNSYMITAYGEYTLPGSSLARTVHEHEPLTTQGVQLNAYEKRGTEITADVKAPDGGQITLPLFGFDGYRVQLDGQEMAWTRGDNNRLTVEMPPDTDGQLRVWFGGKSVWRMADGVSLLSMAVLTAWLCRRRKKAAALP